MAHLIKEMDSAVRPASAPASWHGLERVNEEEITSASQMPEIAYPVRSEKVELPEGYVFSGDNCSRQIVGHHPSNKIVIATCSPEYQVIGNDEIFEKTMEAFQQHNIPAQLSFALTMDNGKKVSYAFAIENQKEFFVNGSDEHKMFVNIVSSHDKTLGLKLFGSATRVVCNNTLQMALRGKKGLLNYTFFHNKQGLQDFSSLPTIIEASLHQAQAYSELAEKMGNRPITMHEAKAIATEILAGKKAELSTQVYNHAEGIANLFQNGKGNKGANLYDLFNGVTEYFTSGDGSGKKVDKYTKAVSADYGNAAEKKVYFLNALQQDNGDLLSDSEIDGLIANGKRLLKSYEDSKAAAVAA